MKNYNSSKIFTTTDYSKFKFIETNRPLHVSNGLRESIKRCGFIHASPIIVNQKFEILDGQNRFSICQEFKVQFSYCVITTKNREEDNSLIITFNKDQKQWRLVEYIHHHAERGIKFHSTVREFEERYRLGWSNSILFCSSADRTDGIREGKNLSLFSKRDEAAELVLSCKQLQFHKQAPFCRAIKTLLTKATPTQVSKLKRKHLSIPHSPTASAYLTAFSNIINRGTTGNTIYF